MLGIGDEHVLLPAQGLIGGGVPSRRTTPTADALLIRFGFGHTGCVDSTRQCECLPLLCCSSLSALSRDNTLPHANSANAELSRAVKLAAGFVETLWLQYLRPETSLGLSQLLFNSCVFRKQYSLPTLLYAAFKNPSTCTNWYNSRFMASTQWVESYRRTSGG